MDWNWDTMDLGKKLWAVLPNLFKGMNSKFELKMVDDTKAQINKFTEIVI